MQRRYSRNDLLDTNEHGLALIRTAEAFAPAWYRCPAGAWTIGYGTREDLMPGIDRQHIPGPIKRDEADGLLLRSLIQIFEPAVEQKVRVPVTSNQSSALVSFVYNVGVQAFQRSTLLRKLNRGDYTGAAAEFERWVYSGGQVLPGLQRRRKAEQLLFLADDALVPSMRLMQMEPLPPMTVGLTKRSLASRLHLRVFSSRG